MRRSYLLAFAGALALGACSPSPPTDEEIAAHIAKAATLSELFLAACSDTNIDIKRIRHVADLAGWQNGEDKTQGGTTAVSWRFQFQNKPAVVVASAGTDPRQNSPTRGKEMQSCGIVSFASPEPDLADRIKDALSLKRIEPADYEMKQPEDSIRMSATGKEDGSLEAILSLNPQSTVLPKVVAYLGREKP